MKFLLIIALLCFGSNINAQTSKSTKSTNNNKSKSKKVVKSNVYFSRLKDPMCGDYCSIILIDSDEKSLFYQDLNQDIQDLLIVNEDTGDVLNPKYADTKFYITTKFISHRELISKISLTK
jgi:hypothetical protein